jgi:hypothetical protein
MIVLIDGLQDLVRLFQQVGLQRVMGLFPVPGAPVDGAKRRHELDEFGKSFRHGAQLYTEGLSCFNGVGHVHPLPHPIETTSVLAYRSQIEVACYTGRIR